MLRHIPISPIYSRPMALVGRLTSADWIGMEISNMFNTGSWPTIMKSVVNSADSGLELADFNTNPAKVGVLARAFSQV